ncbi:hypothetical protein [Roseateles puraquae]|uniref:Uncharacterized protein n=1 Tax=Roseateles puraquae TaxID=431059 RepID=A0A254N3J5_9BURK|nr:hypothetical protein [Roseateles puraquae]MDG0856372.1 hypothetical protein [Roseateles puraquae]OWR02400.1 hypothetical protein CDO81_19620 [Roseateles puraquae]
MNAASYEKRLATAKAEAALLGAMLHALEGDGGLPLYVITWRALTCSFDSLEAVDAWLQRFGGRKS